ncbi:MAG: glycosyltransferase family 4 protein [Nitrososphaerota archaeon]
MKILYITLEDISLHKGSVVHIKEVIEGLKNRGHIVGLIAGSTNKKENYDKFYNLKKYGLKKQNYLILSFNLLFYLLNISNKYDIIYARDFHTALIALLPKIIFNKKLVFEMNGIASEEQKLKDGLISKHLFNLILFKAETLAARHSDIIICVTRQIAEFLIKNNSCLIKKINIVTNGVNTQKFCSINDKLLISDFKKKIGIDENVILVLFVGNLAPWQGVDTLIETGFLILNKIPNIKFLIIGEGNLKNKLFNKVMKSKYKDNYIFTGMVNHNEIPLFINSSDICVAPFIKKRNYKTGLSPLKIFEYLACSKPVITSKIEGLEFIEQYGAGILIEPENKEDLYGALIKLIENPKLRKEMGEKGQKLIRELNYDWLFKIIEIEKILLEIMR